MSLTPWSSGRPLVWDATCPDTFAVSYRGQVTNGAGCVAASAEERKALKYSHLTPSYLFTPVAIETCGAICPRSRAFLRELGRRVRLESGEVNSTSYLLQRISGCAAGECGGCHWFVVLLLLLLLLCTFF